MISHGLRISLDLRVTLKASHSRWCCREAVIKTETPTQWGNAVWWAVSLPTYQPPGHAVLGKASCCLNSRLDFDTPFSGWFLLQGRRKDVQMQLVMPFMPCLGRKCSPCAVSYCLYLFYNSTDFTLLEGISWEIHSWCSLSWFVCSRNFFRNMGLMLVACWWIWLALFIPCFRFLVCKASGSFLSVNHTEIKQSKVIQRRQ